MKGEVVVGIDVGSGSERAIAIDRSGTVLATATAPYPARQGFAVGEADPSAWMEGLSAAFGGLSCEAPLAMCVGGHAPNTVASTGELAITFRNPAGAADGQIGQHAAHAALLQERLGDHVEPRHMWDYLLGRLGGTTDTQSVWPPLEPLEGYGDPVPVGGTAVGTSDGSHGIPEGITLVPGIHDGLLTAWAASIDTPGRGYDPGGRTGGLGIAVDENEHAEVAKFGMPSQVRGTAIVGGPVASHGAIMDWWSGITGRTVAELLEMAADAEPGAGGVMVLPFLEGERAPRWNLGLRAEILGLSSASDVGVVTRALLESTAYGLGHIARSLADRGVVLDRVVSCGGPARSPLWTSIKAAVLEVPIDVPACDEMAAYGSALGAGAAVGWWPRPGEGASGDWPMPDVTTYEPEPLEVYRRGLDRFIALGDEAVERLERTNKTK